MTKAAKPAEAEPKTDLTAEEAFGSLNYFEMQDMKKHFHVSMGQLEELAVEAMFALVWVLERRSDATRTPAQVQSMTFNEVSGYFAQDDPAGELGDQGKDEPNAAAS